MLDRMIQSSLRHRGAVVAFFALLLIFGWSLAFRLPVEVLPDLTKPTVVILTEAPGLAPEEVETRVTQPLERRLMGVAGLTRLRSNSDVGLSLIYAEFDWNTDIYQARLLVNERLQGAGEEIGFDPRLTPVASLMGEILLVGVRSTIPQGEPGYLPPAEVRTLADWEIRPKLLGIPGVAEVLSMGGGVRQLQILPDPTRMQAFGITLEEVEKAAQQAASTTTGGFLETGAREWMVRNLAMTTDPEALGQTLVRQVDGVPVTLADVATLQWGTAPMRGDASISRYPEKEPTHGVIISITKAPGFDTRALTERVLEALEAVRPSLPAGTELIPLFQQKDFIDHAIGNLTEAIRDGAIMVIIVLFLFLLNLRTTLITLMAIPTSFAITVLTFAWWGISVNSMTLGGLAVAIGMVVDDAIVDVENVFRRLRENPDAPRLSVIAKASAEVRHSILYATLLIILVFIPLLGLSGVEGRLFAPIALATMISMAASFFVSLTLIPVLCSYLLRPSHEAGDGWLVRVMKAVLERTMLALALRQPLLVLTGAVLLLVASAALYPAMNKDFLPRFQEETALVAATAAPGTSLEEMTFIADAMERLLLTFPEIDKIGRRLGRAEQGDHVVPVSTVEFDLDFKKDSTRNRQETLEEIAARLRTVPGVFSVISGPLADRIGHMMSGVSAPVAIKIFGPDLAQLRALGEEIAVVARAIPGFESTRLDFSADIEQLRIEPQRERLLAWGLTPGHLNESLSTLLGGKTMATLQEGQRSIDLVLRLPQKWRESPEGIREIPIALEDGAQVPLEALAEIRLAKGPNTILREQGQRRFALAIQPESRDVSTLVTQLKKEVSEKVTLPQGYRVEYEGEFAAREEALRRIGFLSAIVFAVIFLLLQRYFGSTILALQVLVNIPLALMGGLALTWLTLNNISIATLVGAIAVGGIAARNGIMMISHYLHLMRHEGESFNHAMIIRGTKERLVPVMMTALCAGIGLLPLVFGGDQPGKEILHPVAIVIVGGLASSTLLDMAVTPAMFWLFGRKAAERSLSTQSHASH